jgi:uncharacterized protein (TIGR03435 family)
MRNHAARALFLAAALLLLSNGTSAQVPTAYDYTSIKPPNQKVPHFLEGSLDTIAAAHITLLDLITIEYPYSPDRIVGLTPEQRNTRFDVVAKIDPLGVPDPEHDPHAYRFMIDALLKNHFRLIVHENDKPFAQLMVIGNATKLASCPPAGSPSTTATSNHIASECITMDEFATRLSNQLNIQVVNQTSLPGTFAIALNWTPAPIVPSTARGGFLRLPPSLLAALRGDLGLALVPSTSEQNRNKILVVDHVEFPVILELTKASTAE